MANVAIKALTKPFQRRIGSSLEQSINKLPEDFTMIEKNIPQHLKDSTAPLKIPGLKDEEIEFSGIFNFGSEELIGKKELQKRLLTRRDRFTETTLTAKDKPPHAESTLPEFKSNNYEEKIRRFNFVGESLHERDIQSHYKRLDIPDELYWTRRDIIDLDGENGRMIFEIQADVHQTGRKVGTSIPESRRMLKDIGKAEEKNTAEITSTQLEITDLQDSTNEELAAKFDDADAFDNYFDSLKQKVKDLEKSQQKISTAESNILNSLDEGLDTFRTPFMDIIKTGSMDEFGDVVKKFGIEGMPEVTQLAGTMKSFMNRIAKIDKTYSDSILSRREGEMTKIEAIEEVQEEARKFLTAVFENKNIAKSLKGQFGLVPQETPFAKNFALHAIESELVDAWVDGLKFITVPIEVGSHQLARGPGVQKWYERTIRSTMEKRKNSLNAQIKEIMPNWTEDNLFRYESRQVKTEANIPKTVFTETNKVTDIDEFIASIPDRDVQYLINTSPKVLPDDLTRLADNQWSFNNIPLFDESEFQILVDSYIDRGVYTNIEHASNEARRQIIRTALNKLPADEIQKIVRKGLGGIDEFGREVRRMGANHTLDIIFLPKSQPMKSQALRSVANQEAVFDKSELLTYVNNATIQELKDVMELIGDFDYTSDFTQLSKYSKVTFWEPRNLNEVKGSKYIPAGESTYTFWKNAKLNAEGEKVRKDEILAFFNNFSEDNVKRAAAHTGIKLVAEDEAVSGIFPIWMGRISQFAVVPGIGVSATEDYIENLENEMQVKFSEKNKKALIAKQTLRQDKLLRAEIGMSLKKPGVNNVNLVDFLTNNKGWERDTAQSLVDEVIKSQVTSSLQSGAGPNEIFDKMLAKGYKPEDINDYLPQETILQQVFEFEMNNLQMTESMLFGIGQFITGFQLESEGNADKASEISARIDSANYTVGLLLQDFGIPLSTEMAVEMKQQSNALAAQLIKTLTEQQIDFKVGDYGDILLPDSNGVYIPFDPSYLDIALARRDELMGAIAGGFAGAKVGAKVGARTPGPPIVKAAGVGTGALIGAATGSAFFTAGGRGTDILRNRLYLKQEIDGKFIRDEMVRTGAADGIISMIVAGTLKGGGATWRMAKWIYDKTARGNRAGAHRAFMEYLHMTPEKADELVDEWMKLNPKEALKLSENRELRQFEVLSRTDPLAYRVAQPAMQLNSQASINLSREINKRARNIQTTIADKTNPRMGAILNEELPAYEKRVRNIYDGTKELAIQQLKKTGYTFDYDKLVIEPTLRSSIDGIDNPAIHDQMQALFQKIKTIGGKKIEVPVSLGDDVGFKTIDLPNPRRGFSELLELRELVVKFAQRKNITGVKDKAKLESMIKNIDSEIKRAVNKNMEDAGDWIEAWNSSKQGFDNMRELRSNVLGKAIVKGGISDQRVLNALVKSAESLDGTYRQVLQALPRKLHAPVEAAVIRELVEKNTIKNAGDIAGLQAIDFVSLDKQLKHIPMGTESNKKFKQAISSMARVYKNDPHLLAASGTVRGDSFATFLTDDPIIRIKYATITQVFNYIKRLLPTEGGRKAAMLVKLGQVLRKPHDSSLINELMTRLPPDPIANNQLRQQIAEIADWNARSTYPKVEVYGTSRIGFTGAPIDGPLGKGQYFYINKTKARTKSRITKGSKLYVEELLPDHIADENIIREILNLPEDTIITPAMIKGDKQLKKILEEQAYNGIIIKDTIIVF